MTALSSTQIMSLVALIVGGETKRAASRQEAAARLAKLSDERNLDLDFNTILNGGSFDAAKAAIQKAMGAEDFSEDDIPGFLKKNRMEAISENIPEPKGEPTEREAAVDAILALHGAEDVRGIMLAAYDAGVASKGMSRAKKPPQQKAERGTTKREVAASLLLRPEGATAKDILEATGWPAVSVPAIAKASNLALRQEKDGRALRYYGSAE